MLEQKDNPDSLNLAIHEFDRNWEVGQDANKNPIDLPLNPNIRFSKWDMDSDLMQKKDWAELFKYDKNFFETKNALEEKMSAGAEWLDLPEKSRMVVNYANWISMQKKAHLMLKAYHDNILPNIKKVLAVQINVELPDDQGNVLNGVVDLVAELQDGRIMVLDNKTASQPYDDDSVALSEQLAKYYAILNIQAADPEHEWSHHLDGAGYCVMSKKLVKDVTKVCKECGHVANGSHKKCDNEIDGERCNGEWDKTVKVEAQTQFITGTISEKYAAEVLENASVVKSCIEMGFYPKNFSACSNQYGSPCQFIGLCHKGSTKGLVKLEEKK